MTSAQTSAPSNCDAARPTPDDISTDAQRRVSLTFLRMKPVFKMDSPAAAHDDDDDDNELGASEGLSSPS